MPHYAEEASTSAGKYESTTHTLRLKIKKKKLYTHVVLYNYLYLVGLLNNLESLQCYIYMYVIRTARAILSNAHSNLNGKGR